MGEGLRNEQLFKIELQKCSVSCSYMTRVKDVNVPLSFLKKKRIFKTKSEWITPENLPLKQFYPSSGRDCPQYLCGPDSNCNPGTLHRQTEMRSLQ